MPDMLAKLYWQRKDCTWPNDLWNAEIEILRPDIGQKRLVLDWIVTNFNGGWAEQAGAAFQNRPLTIFIAVQDRRKIVGFACFDAVRRNFFGPIGVAESCRNSGVGSGLVAHCFGAMREAGYEYAIIHAVGPMAFYSKVCGAEPVPDSEAGLYRREIVQ
jgi:hypothetical protein